MTQSHKIRAMVTTTVNMHLSRTTLTNLVILNRLSGILQNVLIYKYHLCSVILSIFLHDYTAEAYA